MGLPGRGRGDDLPREAGSEHEGLELQPAVQQPQQAQRDLQVAAGDANAVGEREIVCMSVARAGSRGATRRGRSSL